MKPSEIRLLRNQERFRNLFSSYVREAERRNDGDEVLFLLALKRHLPKEKRTHEVLKEARRSYRDVRHVHRS